MTISERKLRLQEGLLKHASELLKDRILAQEEKVKHHLAYIWMGRGLVVLGVSIIISAAFQAR